MAKNRKHPNYKPPSAKPALDTVVLQLPTGAEQDVPSPLEAFPEHAQLIAYLIAEWSQIEYKLAVWLAMQLTAHNDVVLPMVYALETSRARLQMMTAAFNTLAIERPKAERDRLAGLLKEARGVLQIRNRYAHGHFGPDRKSGELAIAALRTTGQDVAVPLHDLRHQLSLAKSLSNRIGFALGTALRARRAALAASAKGKGDPSGG